MSTAVRFPGYLSRTQLAYELGCSERTLARWAALRKGPPVVRIPGTKMRLYSRDSVTVFLRKVEADGAVEAARG